MIPCARDPTPGDQRFRHSVSGFTEGHYQDTRVGVQVIEIFAHAQNTAFALHVAVKTPRDRCLRKGLKENGRAASRM